MSCPQIDQSRKIFIWIKLSITKETLWRDTVYILAPGLPVPVIWTHLAHTAQAGEMTLILQEAVTWKPGDKIVIASTGHRYDVFWAWWFWFICRAFLTLQRKDDSEGPQLFDLNLKLLIKIITSQTSICQMLAHRVCCFHWLNLP